MLISALVLLVAFVPPPRPACASVALRSAARAAVVGDESTPRTGGSLAISKELLQSVKSELWRTSEASLEELASEQCAVIAKVLGPIAALDVGGGASSPPGSLPPLDAETEAALNAIVAPHLPVLLGRSFPQAARAVLPSIRTESERGALLALSQLVVSAQQEVADALALLQWRQQLKLRELCDAASDGGTERLAEMAEAMREELDTDFCNYLNAAIDEEEARLRARGAEPFVPKPTAYGSGGDGLFSLPADLMEEEREEQALARAEAARLRALRPAGDERKQLASPDGGGSTGAGGSPWDALSAAAAVGGGDSQEPTDEASGEARREARGRAEEEAAWGAGASPEEASDEPPALPSGWRSELSRDPNLNGPPSVGPQGGAGEGEGEGGRDSGSGPGGGAAGGSGAASEGGSALAERTQDPREEQRWLLVLRLVRQGVYAMLATDYEEDVKQLRYIIGLAAPDVRARALLHTLMRARARVCVCACACVCVRACVCVHARAWGAAAACIPRQLPCAAAPGAAISPRH